MGEISSKLNISKVTIRKCMDYLENIDYLTKNIENKSLGRPSVIYEKINS